MCGLAAAMMTGLAGVSAEAATITRTYDFTLFGFTGVGFTGETPPAPADPLSGSFTVTFDTAVAIYYATDGLTVHSLNLSVDGPFAFSYTPMGMLSFSGRLNDGGVVFGTNDFYVGFFQPLNDTPIAPSGFYSQVGASGGWGSTTGSVTAQTVPEPAVWALMILGFGATGAVLRRRAFTTA